jgi:hypothetical protein
MDKYVNILQKVIGEPWFPGLTLKRLIYEGTNGMKPLVTEFVTQLTEFVT